MCTMMNMISLNFGTFSFVLLFFGCEIHRKPFQHGAVESLGYTANQIGAGMMKFALPTLWAVCQAIWEHWDLPALLRYDECGRIIPNFPFRLILGYFWESFSDRHFWYCYSATWSVYGKQGNPMEMINQTEKIKKGKKAQETGKFIHELQEPF